MKKRCLLFLLCLFLASCQGRISDIEELDAVIDAELAGATVYRQDHNGAYFDYYLPSDIYEVSSKKDAVILSFNDEKILMNLNITSIIARQDADLDNYLLEEGFYAKEDEIYYREGHYLDFDQDECAYVYAIYDVDGRHLAILKTDDMTYYAYTGNDLALITKRLFMLAESASVDRDLVVNDYANVDMIDYRREQVNLFETIVPQEGRLEDIVIDTPEPTANGENITE